MTGAGQKEARLKVLTALVGAPITQGAVTLLGRRRAGADNLTRAVVDEVLAGTRWAGVPSGAGGRGAGRWPTRAAEAPNGPRTSRRRSPGRAEQDDIEAQRAAEQAQAEAYDPTTGREWQA